MNPLDKFISQIPNNDIWKYATEYKKYLLNAAGYPVHSDFGISQREAEITREGINMFSVRTGEKIL